MLSPNQKKREFLKKLSEHLQINFYMSRQITLRKNGVSYSKRFNSSTVKAHCHDQRVTFVNFSSAYVDF